LRLTIGLASTAWGEGPQVWVIHQLQLDVEDICVRDGHRAIKSGCRIVGAWPVSFAVDESDDVELAIVFRRTGGPLSDLVELERVDEARRTTGFLCEEVDLHPTARVAFVDEGTSDLYAFSVIDLEACIVGSGARWAACCAASAAARGVLCAA
jgi:hypothetical protein